MLCPRCKVKMRVSPTVHHKRRKWICPRCGRAKMESKAARGSAERKGRPPPQQRCRRGQSSRVDVE